MRRGVKQKRLQLPTKFSDVVVGLANPGWQTVPESRAMVQRLRSSDRRAVLVHGTQHVSMSADRSRRRSAWETSWQSSTRICCSCIVQRLVDVVEWCL